MSTTQEAPGAQESITEEPFTPAEVARLVVNSFRFSRGSEEVQKAILHYMAAEYSARLAAIDANDTAGLLITSAFNIVNNPSAHPQSHSPRSEDEVAKEVHTQLRHFRSFIHAVETSAPAKDEILHQARDNLIFADSFWTPLQDNESEPVEGIYTSNLALHGIQRRSAGMPEYDRLFSEVIDDLLNPASMIGEDDCNNLLRVLAVHGQMHPESRKEIKKFKEEFLSAHPPLEVADAA